MMSVQFQKFAAANACRSLAKFGQSASSISPLATASGAQSLFSTISPPDATAKKPLPVNNYGRFIFPSTIPSSQTPTPRDANKSVLKSALLDLEKIQKKEINDLQWLLDSLRIAQMPATLVPKNQPKSTVQQEQQLQHTFQVMNRNARKAKRANHGKRPCSRDRRRWKIKKWANTSRR